MEQVSNYKQKIQFVTGFAGSGKSTKLANSAGKDVLVLTPTHKAADVLRGKGIENVFTIYAVLGLVPQINDNFRKGQKLQKLTKVGNVDLSEIKKIAIDEYSMIPTKVLDYLLEVLPDHALVLIFGDPYQLPPVDGDPVDWEMYTDNHIELTTQHRAKAPNVVETFMRFMNYIKNPSPQANLLINPNYPDLCRGDLTSFNPDTDRILAYTNDCVIALNTQVAKLLDMPKKIQIGEDVFCNDLFGTKIEGIGLSIFPTCISKGKLMDDDKLLLTSARELSEIKKWGTDLSMYNACTVSIEDMSYDIYYDEDHYANAKKFKAEVEKYQHWLVSYHKIPTEVKLSQWCRENKGAKYVKERGKAWSDYLKHQNLVFSMRRPYATTVHKAQGQEFSTVFIDQNDMKKAIRNGYYEQYARLIYVSLSRAVNKVVIL